MTEPKFKVGDRVDFVNDNGVVFPNRVVTGYELRDGKHRYFFMPHDAHWFPAYERNLRPAAEPFHPGEATW